MELGADGIPVAHHTGELDRATGPEGTCDAQHLRVRNKPFLKDKTDGHLLFQHIHPSLPAPSMPLTRLEAGGNYSRLPAGDSLGKCNAGLESSRVVFPGALGPGSTASRHCQNTPGVSLELLRETF